MLDLKSPLAKYFRLSARPVLCLAALILVCSTVFGQDDSPPPTDASEITRERRAAEAAAVEDEIRETAETASEEELRVRIEEARPGPERAALQRRLVDLLVATNRKTQALDELRLMIHEERYDPAFFYNTGNSLARLGDATAAVDAYRKAISQRRGRYARAFNNLGVILMRQGRWDEAQDAFIAALTQEHRTYAEASYNLGRLYLLRGETGLAIREWKRTLKLQPDHTAAAAALARAYAEDGNPRRGLSVIEAYAARGRRMGDSVPASLADTRREIVEVVNVKNNNDGASSGMATANRPAGLARAAATRVYEVDQATYDLLQTAREAREGGQYEMAAERYRRVLARRGDKYFPPANLELAFALMNLQRTAEAIEALRPVAEKDGTSYPIAHFHLGLLYSQLNQFDSAARHLNRAVELYGDQNPQATLYLSGVYEKQGDYKGAHAAMHSYVRMIEGQGSVPQWAAERLAKLEEKTADRSVAPAVAKEP